MTALDPIRGLAGMHPRSSPDASFRNGCPDPAGAKRKAKRNLALLLCGIALRHCCSPVPSCEALLPARSGGVVRSTTTTMMIPIHIRIPTVRTTRTRRGTATAIPPDRTIARSTIATAASTKVTATTTTTALPMVYEHDLRDPDLIELVTGGIRYENVPLPDSMLDTTIFVGNLCEFARDEDLSEQFRSVTKLRSLPACVARRPNNQSLRYGFVAFPTVEEKEAAILRFHGVEFMGRRLKVEEILDHPSKGRVHVPEKLVTYVLGAAKKTPRRKTNDRSLRKISNPSKAKNGKRRYNNNHGGNNNSSSGSHGGNGKTQGGRKGDRKQKRANVKKRRRRERERDFFF